MEPTRGKTDAIRFEPRDGKFIRAGEAWVRRSFECMMHPNLGLAVVDNSA